MMCSSPYITGNHVFGCGQCLACKINKRRIWAHRIMLEAMQYTDNAFVTLTYREEDLPRRASLDPRDMQLFLKRLRKKFLPRTFRYFGAGEYGSEQFSERPHYHLALFNYPACLRGRTDHARIRRSGTCCDPCDAIAQAWGFGGCDVGQLEPSSAAYICGYITKKMTSETDIRLKGRHPEFARMSLKPGLGAGFMDEVASTLLQYGLEGQVDVPSSLRHGSSVMPLGRYLTRRLRERVGLPPEAPYETIEEWKSRLHFVQDLADRATAEAYGKGRSAMVKAIIQEINQGKAIQMASKQRQFERRRYL